MTYREASAMLINAWCSCNRVPNPLSVSSAVASPAANGLSLMLNRM
jgi:hypothetical protein